MRDIIKAAEEGRKTMTEQAELTAGELTELVYEALRRAGIDGGIQAMMTGTQVGNILFEMTGLCFDAGYAVGLRKGKRISRAKRYRQA